MDCMLPGDDVTVYGVMCLRWKPFYDGALCDVELVLKANNIEVNNQQAAAGQLVKDAQEEFEEFWNSYKHNPIAGMYNLLCKTIIFVSCSISIYFVSLSLICR